MSEPQPWKKHASGLSYRLGQRKGELLYKIQGSDEWLNEGDFNRRCEINSREIPRTFSALAEPADHQGPLRGPGPQDNRLFPAEANPRDLQGRDRSTAQHYELRSRESGYGTTSTLVSRTRSADTGVNLQPEPRKAESGDRPVRLPAAEQSQLSALARAFLGLKLGNYSEASEFILDNPGILAKGEIDALITEASSAEKAGQSGKAHACIHQALLLREAGLDKGGSFFRRLTAKDGRAKDAFGTDVKKVYLTIQQQAAKAPQQSQASAPEPQGRKMPVISQAVERPTAQGPHEKLPGTTVSRAPVVRDRDGRLYYTDNQGNILRPASSRPDPDRHRPVSDPIETTEDVAASSMKQGAQSGANALESRRDNRHARGRTTSFHHPVNSDLSGPLPIVPELSKLESTRIGGTKGDVEKLDHRYYVRKNVKEFFERGRVFALLWHESAGGGGGTNSQRNHTELSDPVAVRGRFGEEVYSHIRRMVVVKEGHGFSLCLPINTYNGKGVTKPGLSDDDREAHSIVYMTDTRPFRLPEETKVLIKKEIAVEKAGADQKLDSMSRLNFKKIYTIEHNVKVMSVGRVTRESLPVLLGYWRNCLID